MVKNILFIVIILFVIVGVVNYINKSPIQFSNPNPKSQEQIVQAQTNGKIISGSFDKTKLKSNDEWKKILTPNQYSILRDQGTETPFTGALEYEKRKGTYYSAGCNEPVFSSDQKYDSGTGWPSFWQPISSDAVVLREDNSLPGETRIEVLDKCGGHLGHVFDDGPQPTGKRYCINSAALIFKPQGK